MGTGKSSGNQSTQAQLTPEQLQTINLQNQFLSSYLPTLGATTQGAQNVYQQVSGNNANQAGITQGAANQAGQTQLNTGTSALNSGVSGLQSLFSPQYEQQQVQGALGPAQIAAQQANVKQEAGCGGAGEMGSARDALAAQQTQNMQTQELGSIAAQTEAGIQQQQAAAANALAQTGTANLGAATGTFGQGINASTAPIGAYNQYASTIYGAPSQTPNYAGTQSSTSSGNSKGKGASAFGTSDIRLKSWVNSLNYGLKEVLQFAPISWFWKEKAMGSRREIGFNAQHIKTLIPEVVHEENGILRIDYPKLTSVLANAISEQQAQIELLSKRIDERSLA